MSIIVGEDKSHQNVKKEKLSHVDVKFIIILIVVVFENSIRRKNVIYAETAVRRCSLK